MNNYFMETHHHEWILTNRKGSYALGTGNLINQRKYHGLLVASDAAFNRRHLIAGMEEKVEWRGEIIHLDSNNYSNCIYPEGFLYLVKPWLKPYPIFLYSALPHQNEILIKKEIMMDEERNLVMVKYTNLGHHKLHFHLHPKFTMVPHHELNQPGSLDHESFETWISEQEKGSQAYCKRLSNSFEVFTYAQGATIESNRYVYYNVYYPWEVMSGYAGISDQISLFELSFELQVNESKSILFSDLPIDDADKAIQTIENRYADLPKPKDYPVACDMDDSLISMLDYEDSKLFKPEDYLKLLKDSLKTFIANDDIVAGYPYYGSWGRDSMFVLNVILHMPGNLDLVQKSLAKYGAFLRDGMIPNLLPESGRELNYDTVDATLWYLILQWKLAKAKDSPSYWKMILTQADEILGAFIHNETHPFRLREDGLIELLPEFAHATWMDVRQDGKAVCPRDGAPVEINALWYNAICIYEEIYAKAERKRVLTHSEEIFALKDKVYESMQKYRMGDYLADRLQGDVQVGDIRPNALIALSLPHSFLDTDMMKQVFERAQAELYTPYGIRTLSPKDIRFRKKYYGSQRERDLAAHNGSVWAWLLSPFCGLYSKIYRGELTDLELAEKLEGFVATFRKSYLKGHISSIAEIWDGDNPHFPKGAPALAMSVAAIYNIESFIASLRGQA